MTVHIVTYFMHDDADRAELRKEITDLDHLKLSGSSYLVDSDYTTEDLFDLLYEYIVDEEDNLFVAEVIDPEWNASNPDEDEWLEDTFLEP